MGLIARQLEAAGIATVCLTSAIDITRSVNPPRSVHLDFPLGHTSGRPNRPDLNREIVRSALAAFDDLRVPGSMVHLSHRWADSDGWKDTVMRTTSAAGRSGAVAADDDRVERYATPQYQSDADATAAAETHSGSECEVCAGIDF